MSVSSRGTPPDRYIESYLDRIDRSFKEALRDSYEDIREATPVGASGQLKAGWKLILPPKIGKRPASITNTVPYLVPVELGRKKGKGISVAGQLSVKQWAQKVLGLDADSAQQFAQELSDKYKKYGRKAQGFLGLAREGAEGGGRIPNKPISGSILDHCFKKLDNLL